MSHVIDCIDDVLNSKHTMLLVFNEVFKLSADIILLDMYIYTMH
jgi:hypothetical protein